MLIILNLQNGYQMKNLEYARFVINNLDFIEEDIIVETVDY